jgi:hypothetical protein
MQIRPLRLSFGARVLAAVGGLILLIVPANAANPVFPTGSRLGIVPPAGMVQSRNFLGFEDPQKNAAILFTTLPARAYDALDKSMVPETMKKDGVDMTKREPIQLGIGKGFVISGVQTTDKARYRKWLLVLAAGNVTALATIQVPEQDKTYPDKVIRDTLATLAIRDSVPDAEQISLMPFAIGDLAGFHVDESLPGRAIMLVERADDAGAASPSVAGKGGTAKDSGGAKDQSKDQDKNAPTLKARLFIAAVPGGPSETSDRASFARLTFQGIAGIKDVQVQDAEPLRIGNQPGFETLAKAKDAQSDTDVMVVQWLRFGTSGFLQMIGIVRADAWPTVFNRLRAVRDSIESK